MRKRGDVYVHMYRVGPIIISFVLSLPSSNDIRVQCHLADAQSLLIYNYGPIFCFSFAAFT